MRVIGLTDLPQGKKLPTALSVKAEASLDQVNRQFVAEHLGLSTHNCDAVAG